jgi:hypothetical protein
MVDFSLWTHIEHAGPGRYLVKVSAIPRGVEERCAPEERTVACTRRSDAQLAARELARRLARGNCVAAR